MKNPEVYTENELNALCQQYQKLMRIQDWDITVEVVGSHILGEEVHGDHHTSLSVMRSKIRICDPASYVPTIVAPELNMRQTLIHELVHIVFSSLGPSDDDAVKHCVFENGIERIACIIYELTKDVI